MPELPDVQLYLDALKPRLVGATLVKLKIMSPFVLRSVDPPIDETSGKLITGLGRLGKRIVIELEPDLFLVIHLMIAGRFRWYDKGSEKPIPKKLGLAAFELSTGTLVLTEAGTRKRASLYLVRGEAGLEAHNPGGVEVLDATLNQFSQALTSENHTLKRALTDPRLFSGIGNAYSDEILHAARMSPLRQTRQLDAAEIERLYRATQATLKQWIERLRAQTGDRFPEKVTAFRDDMAVHGRFGLPCPACGSPVQRIAYAENEVNYCPTCQTGGKLLADRALSRLLKSDWPRTLEEMEALRTDRRSAGPAGRP